MTIGSAKHFQYVTPPLTNLPAHIKNTTLLSAAVFHFLASARAIEDQVWCLSGLRSDEAILRRPIIIWEPAPLFCIPENHAATFSASQLVDVVSPNRIELAALFGEKEESGIEPSRVEALTAMGFEDSGIGHGRGGAIVVRAGAQGCFVISKWHAARWFPPFYSVSSGPSPDNIVDPTGAGNAFLGSYGVGLLGTGSIMKVACYGAIGASFALEQTGVPELKIEDSGQESWNGADAR